MNVCEPIVETLSDYSDDAFEILSDCSCCNELNSESDEEINLNNNEFNSGQIQDDIIMFPAADITASDVLFMVEMFSASKNFTRKDENDLLNLIKTLAGPDFTEWESSSYLRSKMHNVPDDKIILHFFCESCKVILTKKSLKNSVKREKITCKKCDAEFEISSKSTNAFMSPDLLYQIELILNIPEVQDALFHNITQSNNTLSDICDVYDSELYKKLKVHDPNILTLNFNTDGAPIFKSSKRSFWPQQLYINELPLELRFKHIILGGIFLTDKEPKSDLMNLYNSALCDQIIDLTNNGVNIRKYSTHEKVNLKFTLFCCCLDTPARATCQNRMKFNGYWGCSWCYEPGLYVGNAVHYPIVEVEAPLRTHEEHLVNVSEVKKMYESSTREKYIPTIKGVKGSMSFIEKFPLFDSIWGFTNDYMHSCLLGVIRQILVLLDTPEKKYRLNKSDWDKVNKRLTAIKPPHEVYRLPRSTADLCKWKASEFESWLLYYSQLCLDGIVDETFLEMYALLVRGIYTLLQRKITEEDITRSEYDLLQFVGSFQATYGKAAITFNLHALQHLGTTVRKTGPLWSGSAFAFENGIFLQKKCINGPNGVGCYVQGRF